MPDRSLLAPNPTGAGRDPSPEALSASRRRGKNANASYFISPRNVALWPKWNAQASAVIAILSAPSRQSLRTPCTYMYWRV